jgi:NIPSNAP
MITCVIQYTLDPHRIDDFEDYARRWAPIIARCGGKLTGYYLPKEGATNLALALIDFTSLSHYEEYRRQLAADPDARRNLADAGQSRCILVETRSFLRRVDG